MTLASLLTLALALPFSASVAAAAAAPLPTCTEGAEGAFHDATFDEARALAEKEGKLVMVDFFTTWCGPCKKLDAMTWPDPGVQRWLLENVIAIKIDADKDQRTKSLYQVDLYPSIVFMTPDGAELDRLKGFLDAERFLGSARMLVGAAQDGNALAQRATGPEHQVPRTRLAYANYLAGTKRFREAAEHYLWCYDEGLQHDASFARLRRGEVLDNLAQVSRTWLQGKSALRDRRAKAHAALLSEDGTLEDALDLAALDARLGQSSDTLSTYMKLIEGDEKSRARARGLLDAIFDSLIGPKRYAEINACSPDFMSMLEEKLARYEAESVSLASNPRAKNLLEAERSAIVTRGTLWFEALLSTEREADAEALAARLADLDSTARTYLALARRAKRGGHPEAALRWVEAGLERVPEAQKTSLEILGKSLKRQLENAQR